MTEVDQLTMLTPDAAAPPRWVCPTCRGNRVMLRTLYPDEQRLRGAVSEVCRCRTCDGQGYLVFDPDDHSVFPH